MKLWVCFPIPAILCLFLSREEIARPCDQIIKAGYHIVEGEKKSVKHKFMKAHILAELQEKKLCGIRTRVITEASLKCA